MPRESKRKDDMHTEILSLRSRHLESIKRFKTAWASQLDDYKQVYKGVTVSVVDDNVTIHGEKGSAIAISRDVEEFLKQHSIQEEFVDMALNMAKMVLGSKRQEVERLKEESLEDGGEVDISASGRGICIKGTEDICETVKIKIEKMKNDFLGVNNLKSRNNISAQMREQMINGNCDRDVKHKLKETRSDYEVIKDKEVPRAMGIYFSIFDPSEFKTMQAEVACSDKTTSNTNELTTDKMSSKMVSVYFSVNVDESPDNYRRRPDSDFIEQMENEYQTVIEDRTKPDSNFISSGFLHDYMKVQAEDKEHGYILYFCCSDLTTFQCDAIVNSTTPDITFNGQLSGDIRREGGNEVVEECAQFIGSNGRLNTSDVYVSGPGNLDCKVIIHVASPQWQNGGQEKEKELYTAVKNILKKADDLNLYSVALPAISAGGFQFPREISIKAIFSGIKDYFDERTQAGESGLLKRVNLVDISETVISEITEAMKECFGAGKVCDANQRRARNTNTLSYQLHGGKQQDVDKVLGQLRAKCQGMSVSVTKVPPTWSPMHELEYCKVDELHQTAIDYIELEQMFTNQIDNSTVVKIERVQNRELYESMLNHKELIKREAGWQKHYEMKLWHGTDTTGAVGIKKDGFSLKFVGKTASLMGKGLYFAKSAVTSHGYTNPEANGCRFMFRCTVLTGESIEYESGHATSAPDGYHSVNGWCQEAYVVFRNTQCYPDYLITYKMNG